MRKNKKIYVNDRRYKGRRKKGSGTSQLTALALALLLVTAAIAVYRYHDTLFGRFLPTPGETEQTGTTGTATDPAQETTGQTTNESEPEATPTPGPPPAWYNPQLLPQSFLPVQEMGMIAAGLLPADHNLTATVFDNNYNKLDSFSRPDKISITDPLDYGKVPGVLTFRGNNFRNAPAFGIAGRTVESLDQIWTVRIGSLPSSAWAFSWTGTGWTGQPLLVQWDDDIREMMNIIAEKKDKPDLVEVIYAALDGKIYFLDLEDGQPTRPAINVGAPIKGTPCVDPRGWPVLYVGQGDNHTSVDGIGFRVYNLIDQTLLHYKECSDEHSFRPNWGACDSSPVLDPATDTLIFPNENGLVYTARMNTRFNRSTGELSIDPEYFIYRYNMDGLKNHGIESSIAIYNHYGYFNDNSGILHCVDLNTLQPVWSRQLADDSDVTPVMEKKESGVFLYTATEVDWQQDIIGTYRGDAHVYKINALTGEIIWDSTYPCYTKTAADYGDAVNGGVMGTPVVGKKQLSELVYFSFCMTNGPFSGNTVIAFRKSDGTVAWQYDISSGYSWSSPVDVYDQDGKGYIILPDSTGKIHLLDGLTGEALQVLQLTRFDGETTAANIESSCAVFADMLVVGTRCQHIVGVKIN